MHKNLLTAATLVVIFTAGFIAGAYWGVEGTRAIIVKQGFVAHNGQLYQVTGIRPRGE